MKTGAVLLFLVFVCYSNSENTSTPEENHIESLYKLRKLYDLEVIDKDEFENRKKQIIDDYLGVSNQPKKKHFSKVSPHLRADRNNSMPVTWNPQVDWLLYVFNNNMPRSYDDILPASGKSYWRSHVYIEEGAMDYNNTRLPFDSMIAIQERTLSHVGLNLYDGGVWAVALTLAGLSEVVDIYHNNVLYTSSTGSNPQIGGLKSTRAWEPNPVPQHPPDPFWYGVDKILNTDLKKMRMPGNQSFVMFSLEKDCDCPTAGCCEQVGVHEIYGNYFYRMIGPTYIMYDPLQGDYGWSWRMYPIGPNTDETQWWNFAGAIHWNDWKPITGENVWGIILGPMQVLFLKNCSHIPTFTSFDDAPYEVQLAISIMPAVDALISPLGSMYHCPLGTKMFPPDEDEQTNVSNENNFSAYAAYMALKFVFDNYYKGSDPDIDYAKDIIQKALQNLDNWFSKYLLPKQILGEWVISQGGHVSFDGNYEPQGGTQAFAVDCQTWGTLVLGAKKFDSYYSSKTTAYQVWQAAKKISGYYINGKIAGVGYTNPSENSTEPNSIWSGEWTWGAVFACRKMAMEYRAMGRMDWASDLDNDALSMVQFMNQSVIPCDDGVWCGGGLVQEDGSYPYANKRFFIPWGWYANPIGATSSTGWAVFYEFDYNPFMLGGSFNSSKWWPTKCKHNPPEAGLFDKLRQFYSFP